METWVVSNNGATMEACNTFLMSGSSGAFALVQDVTNKVTWAITVTFYVSSTV